MQNQNNNQQQGQASQNVINGYSQGQNSFSQQTQASSGMQQDSQNYGQASSGMQSATGMASQGASQSVIGVFPSRREAEQAVQQLRQQGFTNEEISLVSKQKGDGDNREFVDDDVTDGALTGGTLGGIGGLILGAGALAVPGIGPIIAAGPIAAALSGAVAGGIAGGLIDWGIPAEVSRQYEQSVAQGGTLAVVRTSSQKVNQAAQVLRQNGARDVQSHADKRISGH